ncbi:MAG TPA: hypothetical protein VN031_03620 [Candidatus Microsaccharimonas sp.]|nr:hypothetical protein [Candidatus Microsaccharimonas sp.]
MVLQNFIVLGIIPGTNIQINFQLWLSVVLLVTLIWQGRRFIHSKLLAATLMYLSLRRRQAAIDAITI